MPLSLPRLAPAVLIASILAACGGDDDPGVSATTAASAEATTTAPVKEARQIGVTVKGGAPVGGVRRFDVERGDAVVLTVEADEADEVHVHGYDLKADVAAGEPAEIRFVATIPGVFAVELEGRGVRIAELAVQ